MDSAHPKTPQHSLRKSRSLRACERCRKRKTKCSGELQCRTCRLSGHKCVYEGQDEAETPAAPIAPTPVGNAELASDVPVGTEELDTEAFLVLASGESQLVHRRQADQGGTGSLDPSLYPEAENVTVYHGNSASSSTFSIRLKEALHDQSRASSITTAVREPEPPDPTTETSPSWSVESHRNSIPLDLPPRDTALMLFDAYLKHLGLLFALVDPALFRGRLTSMYQLRSIDLSSRDTRLSYCQTMLVFALGQLYSINQWTSNDGPPGYSYFLKALHQLPDPHEDTSLLFVEVLSMTAYFMQILGQSNKAYTYISLAERMGIAMGLHRELPASTPMDLIMREHRRRTWWSVYSMNRIISCKNGYPVGIDDDDISVSKPLPSNYHDGNDRRGQFLWQYAQASTIHGSISRKLYGLKPLSGHEIFKRVFSILSSLEKWLVQCPSDCRVSPGAMQDSQSQYSASLSVFLHYQNAIIVLTRPLLFHVVRRHMKATGSAASPENPDTFTNQPRATMTIVWRCIEAAMDSYDLFSVSSNLDLIATYGYVDAENLFAAATVLALASCMPAFQSHRLEDATDGSIAIMERMSQRGNAQMRKRLDLLQSFQDKLGRNMSTSTAADFTEYTENYRLNDAAISDAELQGGLDITIPEIQFWEEGYDGVGIAGDLDWL